MTSIRHRGLAKQFLQQNAIEIDDIVQGGLGDCYFLSSLSSLAENPFRIRNLFLSKRINESAGVYCMRICFEGEWRAVYVDDYFPVYPDGSGMCFSKSKKGDNELWVPLLEKAWAKFYGCYERIEDGLTREALRSLTGAPSKVVWNDDPHLWEEILEGEEKDYIMTAGAIDDFSKLKNSEGMVVSHAYSLISVIKLHKTHRLVKLRNPWGQGEWQGAWSDSDPAWQSISEEDKKKIGYNVEDDGCFFMAFDDFVTIYDSVQICMVENENKYDSIRLFSTKRRGVYVETIVDKDGDYFFTVLQPSVRIMHEHKDYDSGKSTIIVAKREGDRLVHIHGNQIVHFENFVHCKGLKAGTYVIYCKVEWVGLHQANFVLSSYGDQHVAFKQIPKEEDFLEKVYLSKAEKPYEIHNKEGYGYYVIENKEEKTVKREINFVSLKGLRMKNKIMKMIEKNVLKMEVPAKQKKIIIFRLEGKVFDFNVKDISVFE